MCAEIASSVSDGIMTVVLTNPERRNALTAESTEALTAALADAGADPSIGGLILAGEAPAFCAGADRAVLQRARDPRDRDAHATLSLVYDLFLAVGRCAVPTIAAVDGAAVGAGLNLALATDLTLVTPRARLVSGFARIGLHPGGGHHALLARRAGAGTAAAMGVFDAEVGPARAVELGLAWELVDTDRVLARARELLQTAAADPELARLLVRSLRRGDDLHRWERELETERGLQLRSLVTR